MTENISVTSGSIRQAASALKKLRPAYTAILDFYEQIFVIQKEAESELKIDTAALKITYQKPDFPLIRVSDFIIDTEASELLFKKICEIARQTNASVSGTAEIMLSAVETEKIHLKPLFSALLNEEPVFEKTARECDIDKAILVFVIYQSIQPSLSRTAEYLSADTAEKEAGYEKGCCPVCGSLPALSTLEGEGGRRFLFCSFCRHKWPTRRIACPFCENRNTEKLHYLYSEEEKEYRTDVCESCGKYIKTVDLRKTGRIFYAPLEQIATLHLDMKAKEAGFKSAIG